MNPQQGSTQTDKALVDNDIKPPALPVLAASKAVRELSTELHCPVKYTAPLLKNLFLELRGTVLNKRPVFKKILDKFGKKTVFEYSEHFLFVKPVPAFEARRPICIEIIRQELEKRLGSEVADDVAAQLTEKPLVNTTDHHAIIDHPFFVNTDIIASLPYRDNKDVKMSYVVVLSFASVSLDNPSGYPRGIMVHGGDYGEGPMIRLPIMADRMKMKTVYGMDPYTREDLNRAISLLGNRQKAGLLSENRKNRITSFINEYLGKEDILSAPDFSTQITKINYDIWPEFFAQGTEPMRLIYLDVESVVKEILLKRILPNPAHLIHKLLFDPVARDAFARNFENIPCAFSYKTDKRIYYGTFLFWGRDDKGYRVGFEPSDSNYLTPESVEAGLRDKRIFPSTMLVYTIISLYYGLKCLGGFSQVHDLTEMKHAFIKTLEELGMKDDAVNAADAQTKEFSGDGIVLAYHKNAKGNFTPSTGIDLMLSEDKLSYDDYETLAQCVYIQEMIGPLVPEMYQVLFPSYNRDLKFSILTAENIMKSTGLNKRLRSLFSKL